MSRDLVISLIGAGAEDGPWVRAVDRGIAAFVAAVAMEAYGAAAATPAPSLERRTPILWVLQRAALPAHALTCLEGMLRYRLADAPPHLQVSALIGGKRAFGSSVAAPLWQAQHFQVDIKMPAGVAPPLTVTVESAIPLLPDGRAALASVFKLWQELMLGGYPLEGDSPGDSGITPIQMRQITPALLIAYAETFRGSPGAFDPLLRMIDQLKERLQLRRIGIE